MTLKIQPAAPVDKINERNFIMNTLTTLSIIFNGLFLGYLLYRLIKFFVDKTENKKREKEALQDKIEFLEHQYRYLNDRMDTLIKVFCEMPKNMMNLECVYTILKMKWLL